MIAFVEGESFVLLKSPSTTRFALGFAFKNGVHFFPEQLRLLQSQLRFIGFRHGRLDFKCAPSSVNE